MPVVVAVCLAWLLYYSVVVVFMVQRRDMADFGTFYYSAQSFLEGRDMYGRSPATGTLGSGKEWRLSQNMNPPHFHLLLLPLAVLDPAIAISVWTIINLLALCGSLFVISRELQIGWTSRRLAWTAAAVICCSVTGTIAVTGQVAFVLLLPVTLAWVAARHNNWNRAAAYLGVCASVKPFLGIFLIYLMLRRDRRPAGVMVFAGAACVVVGLVIFGRSAYEGWLGALASVDWTWSPMNGSLAALVSRAFGENPIYTPVVSASWLIAPATTVLVLSIGAIWLRQLLQSPPRFVDHAFAALLLTAQLVSPLGWIYYLWLIAGPAAAIVQSSKSRACALRDGLTVLALPGLLIPFSLNTLGSSSPWTGLTLGSIYVWTTFFLWGSLMVDWRNRIALSHSGTDVRGRHVSWPSRRLRSIL
jgi:alpha-1,2-mannosyltransferase